jgi:hypothetical protein
MAKDNKKDKDNKKNKMPKPDSPRFSGQVTGAAKEAQSAKVQQTLSTPQVGQRPGQVATVYAPGVTPPKSSSSTPEIKGVGQGFRVAGENGISKSEFKDIAKATGKSPEKLIGKLDKINTKLEGKDKAGINLKSGAANMLVKKAQKSSDKYRGYRTPDFGEGPIGSVLQSMISTPANAGTWIQGQLTGGREADPGFNPGGSPDKNRMIGGTVIRPSGKIAVKGAGQQYELPKRFSGEDELLTLVVETLVVETLELTLITLTLLGLTPQSPQRFLYLKRK